MSMDLNAQKECFSRVYVDAVVAVAGCQSYVPPVDHDKVDLTIAARGPMGTVRSPKLDVQLKATADNAVDGETLRFELDAGTYENLRQTDYQTPRILVVVVIPTEVDDWIAQTPEQLSLRRCGYWLSLRGEPPTANATSITLSIPRSQVFGVEALRALLTAPEEAQ